MCSETEIALYFATGLALIAARFYSQWLLIRYWRVTDPTTIRRKILLSQARGHFAQFDLKKKPYPKNG